MLVGHALRTGELFQWCCPRHVRRGVIAPMTGQNVLFDERGRKHRPWFSDPFEVQWQRNLPHCLVECGTGRIGQVKSLAMDVFHTITFDTTHARSASDKNT